MTIAPLSIHAPSRLMSDWKNSAALSSGTASTTRPTACKNHPRHTGSDLPISDPSGSDVTAHAPSIRPRARIHAIASAQTISRLGWMDETVAVTPQPTPKAFQGSSLTSQRLGVRHAADQTRSIFTAEGAE